MKCNRCGNDTFYFLMPDDKMSDGGHEIMCANETCGYTYDVVSLQDNGHEGSVVVRGR